MLLPMAVRGEPPASPAVDPKADEILRKMGQFLADAKSISFESHALADELAADGQKVQYAKNQKVLLHRPDKLAADVTGDLDDLHLRYDGKQVMLYNPRTNSWGETDAPATIGDTLDMLSEKFGMAIPLADLVFPDPYKDLIERVASGKYIGDGYVFDTKCHHLAFRQQSVDWQIWIEEGDKPLPRKLVITFKQQPGQPQYTAFLSNWNLAADAPDSTFAVTPPAGAKHVDFAPPAKGAEPNGAK
jgi:hypothetical protein